MTAISEFNWSSDRSIENSEPFPKSTVINKYDNTLVFIYLENCDGGGVRRPYFLTIWSRSGCHGQWSKILTMTMAKISAFNHGQMVKISTMTKAEIQIFHGQNGQPKILLRKLAKNANFNHGHEKNTNFLWSKW